MQDHTATTPGADAPAALACPALSPPAICTITPDSRAALASSLCRWRWAASVWSGCVGDGVIATVVVPCWWARMAAPDLPAAAVPACGNRRRSWGRWPDLAIGLYGVSSLAATLIWGSEGSGPARSPPAAYDRCHHQSDDDLAPETNRPARASAQHKRLGIDRWFGCGSRFGRGFGFRRWRDFGWGCGSRRWHGRGCGCGCSRGCPQARA
jgi:hypothetical protein